MAAHLQSSTLWAERQVEEFLSLPLVSEFVFRSPQTVDGSQREVADFLVTCDAPGILISQKCQEDPTVRTARKLQAWACKRAKKAASQLIGALRTGASRPMWCEHRRRGRVDSYTGLPAVAHTASSSSRSLIRSPCGKNRMSFRWYSTAFPSAIFRSTISLISVSSCVQCRKLLSTLIADAPCLSPTFARSVKNGRSLLSTFSTRVPSLAAWELPTLRLQWPHRKIALRKGFGGNLSLTVSVGYWSMLRMNWRPGFPTMLRDSPLACWPRSTPSNKSRITIRIQCVLANLRLRERAELGRAFEYTAEKLRSESQGFVYRAMRLDSQPEWVYIFGSSKRVDRPELLSRFGPLMQGALAYFGKSRCFLVVDRDGIGYEVALSKPGYQATLTDYEVGAKLYGHLQTESRAFSLVP